jgi:succinate dehydrogenase/fumarate reductase flavoprotein subunit
MVQREWADSADVVVIGSGATGLPAAIAACENGASVLIIEANFDVGGHAAISGGNVPLGGGTSAQKAAGIEDDPDLLFNDLTDWSVVQPNGFPDYRYNDREIIRAFADYSAPTYEWLLEQGVIFIDTPIDNRGAGGTGNSAPREAHLAANAWVQYQTGVAQPPDKGPVTSSGIGLVRPLEAKARSMGVRIMLKTKMKELVREPWPGGRVVGVTCTAEDRGSIDIRANKAVVIATGGSTGNVNFRRMFDPRLTEEYGCAGEPFSYQDASGELASMAVGASLWGAFNQTSEIGIVISKAGQIGTQFGYGPLFWQPGSPVFDKARATGLRVADWQDAILVNQKGLRFYDETVPQYTANNHDAVENYVPGSWRNARDVKYNPRNFINAALAGTGEARNGGGPIWAIFDSKAVEREGWVPEPPHVDMAEGYFFKADTIEALAAAIKNKFQLDPMPADVLAATVARYNSFVDTGVDVDFEKPAPKYKIETAPFYAAWSTPVMHDTRVGLRINGKSQVVDLQGEVIPGLYCGGESAGGFSQHGLARCIVQGRIAGINAAAEKTQ